MFNKINFAVIQKEYSKEHLLKSYFKYDNFFKSLLHHCVLITFMLIRK